MEEDKATGSEAASGFSARIQQDALLRSAAELGLLSSSSDAPAPLSSAGLELQRHRSEIQIICDCSKPVLQALLALKAATFSHRLRRRDSSCVQDQLAAVSTPSSPTCCRGCRCVRQRKNIQNSPAGPAGPSRPCDGAWGCGECVCSHPPGGSLWHASGLSLRLGAAPLALGQLLHLGLVPLNCSEAVGEPPPPAWGASHWVFRLGKRPVFPGLSLHAAS